MISASPSTLFLDFAVSVSQKSIGASRMSRSVLIISDIIEFVRIIGGAYRGRKLRTVEGLDVRPTSDRLRETLFNILAPRIKESRFLDICAGSGAIAMEAISRGAQQITLIDNSRRACSVIEANLRTLGIENQAALINREATAALKQLAKENKEFDIVFFDPPYASGIYDQVMRLLDEQPLLCADAIVIVEHRAKTPPEDQYGTLRMYREVKQGESALAFYSASKD
jgi:16S rRNA (guanine966-N2)-methyltransferase